MHLDFGRCSIELFHSCLLSDLSDLADTLYTGSWLGKTKIYTRTSSLIQPTSFQREANPYSSLSVIWNMKLEKRVLSRFFVTKIRIYKLNVSNGRGNFYHTGENVYFFLQNVGLSRKFVYTKGSIHHLRLACVAVIKTASIVRITRILWHVRLQRRLFAVTEVLYALRSYWMYEVREGGFIAGFCDQSKNLQIKRELVAEAPIIQEKHAKLQQGVGKT